MSFSLFVHGLGRVLLRNAVDDEGTEIVQNKNKYTRIF